MGAIAVGSIVKCRGREWVVLPVDDEEVYLLRPLAGTEQEVIGIHSRLHNLGLDRIEPTAFPPPAPEETGDHISVELLFNAARLTLRDGAGPFRSLGHISCRPRPYQFVPMLMALRLDPVRMLIADDVGIGKTVEALLIAREMLDRGEINRICVVCPPYLCSQWKKELWEKFRLDAVIIRSGTISQLQRDLPSMEHSVFGYYPHIIVSIDYVKSDAHRAQFLTHAPKFVIVDEAHGATALTSGARNQQQRFELLDDLASDEGRHMILLTATPHSGVEAGFRSLLGLLRPEFRAYDMGKMAEEQRKTLAFHFVQRQRADVKSWMGESTPFPARDPQDESYELSRAYSQLFEDVYEFSRELVKSGETLSGWKQRIRYWTALALLRCVTSSPAAALAAIGKRLKRESGEPEQDDSEYSPYIFEESDTDAVDIQPAHVLEEAETELDDADRRRLKAFAQQAQAIYGTEKDSKLKHCVKLAADLLRHGLQPIIWCRYIPTAKYVGEQLEKELKRDFPGLRVLSVTGELAEDERSALIADLEEKRPRYRVLVATDCLSEGINLQSLFNSAIHYDLPWNPNRLEQREGRVDRFGQKSPQVKAILYYGRDNPVDGAVLDVLLRKAREIYKSLGVRVPVPMDSESIMETVIKRLFAHEPGQQLNLFAIADVQQVHEKWQRVAESEHQNRTRFAQHAIKPDEVQKQLAETDAVLGDPGTAQRFLSNAAQRLGVRMTPEPGGAFAITGLSHLTELLRPLAASTEPWKITFHTPAPDEVEYLDRNHPFVQTTAQWMVEQALANESDAVARRCGVIRASAVPIRTYLLLARLRYTIETPGQTPLLAEEVQCFGFVGSPGPTPSWLAPKDALELLRTAKAEGNIEPSERTELLNEILAHWETIRASMDPLVEERAQTLERAHKDVRASAKLSRRGMTVARHFPPDLLGLLILLPIPKGVR